MARAESPPDEQPRLRVSTDRAAKILDRHIDEANGLLPDAEGVHSQGTFQEWRRKKQRWIKLTAEGLRTIYTSHAPAHEFQEAAEPAALVASEPNIAWEREDVERGVNVLVSLQERLEYLEEPPADPSGPAGRLTPADATTATVFLVHGRDDERKLQVARLLERTGPHRVVILHEQADKGQTLIEKFEKHALQSAHAVVLLTGDDMGGLATSTKGAEQPELRPRARQNVVFELGFFVGRLSRERVTVLYGPGVEIPSDYAGVVYIELDAGGAWEAQLLLELRSSGLSYDLNRLA